VHQLVKKKKNFDNYQDALFVRDNKKQYSHMFEHRLLNIDS